MTTAIITGLLIPVLVIFALAAGYIIGWTRGSDAGWQSAMRAVGQHPERWSFHARH